MSRARTIARLLAQAVLPAVVLVAGWLVTAALLEGPEQGERGPEGPREEVFAVTAQTVTLGDHRASLRAFGEVVAVEAAELRVSSPGTVVSVHPDLAVGAIVEAGDALLTIDPFAYEGAVREATAALTEARARLAESDARIAMEEAALKSATEQTELAARDLSRAEELRLSGTTSDKAVDDRRLLLSQRAQAADQRRFMLDAERARRDQQMAGIERLEWQREKAERALEDTVLTAPFRAIVRADNVAVGKMLTTSEVAVSLVRAGSLDVRFVLSDRRYGRLLANRAVIGAEVSVIWRIGDRPLSYEATITRVAADIERATGGVDVYARLDLDDRTVVPRPGAFVEVSVAGPLHEGTARLPVAAVYEDRVFVIGADERLEARAVTVLARDDGDAIIRGALADGDEVVTTRLAEAGEGLLVRRVEGGPVVVPTPAPSLADGEGEDATPRQPS